MSGRLVPAIRILQDAAAAHPATAEVHVALGIAKLRRGDPRGAMVALRRATKLDPRNGLALKVLARALTACGRYGEAEKAYRAALRVGERDVDVYTGLADSIAAQGMLGQATRRYRRILIREPAARGAAFGLSKTLLAAGKVEQAAGILQRSLRVRRFRPTPSVGVRTTRAKLVLDLEQLSYLKAQGTGSVTQLIRSYLAVLASLRPEDHQPVIPLTASQYARIEGFYNRPFHIPRDKQPTCCVLSPHHDLKTIIPRLRSSKPPFVVLDEFLCPTALAQLRRFCLESTIWFDFARAGGYFGAYADNGFSSRLLLTIADQLRPCLLSGRLEHLWAYKYDSSFHGITPHADFAEINVNLWITADSACRGGGGLVLYDRKSPKSSTFFDYNQAAMAIRRSLQKVKRTVIPYRCNRAIIFDSSLFHATQAGRFRLGYENRRINITFLFGIRPVQLSQRGQRSA